MSRLPALIANLSPIREILSSLEKEFARFTTAIDQKNRQLFIPSAEEALWLWEKERNLPSSGDLSARRARILAALLGDRTLTVENLKELAVLLGGADRGVVTEKHHQHLVFLSALFDGREPQDLAVLAEVVAQRKPAHLTVNVRSTLPPKEMVYSGTISPLRAARRTIGVAATGNHLLFMGGDNAISSFFATVDTYDQDLVRASAPDLSLAACDGAAGSIGEYAIYAGGNNSNFESTITSAAKVTAYNKDLVLSSPTDLSQKRYRQAGASTPTHFIVGPGAWSGARANVDAYDENLSRIVAANASAPRIYVSSANIGAYGIFAGGEYNGSAYKNVDIYDADLTRTDGPALSNAKRAVSTVSSETHVLLAGGANASGVPMADAEMLDSELVKTVVPALSIPAFNHFGAALESYIIVAGGEGNGSRYAEAECYDENFTKSTPPPLSEEKTKGGSTSPKNSGVINGNIIFAGGYTGSIVSTAEVYTLV